MKNFANAVLGFAIVLAGNVTCRLNAETVVLDVQPSLSSLDLSGNAFFLPYQPQAPGGLTASMSGTISADLTSGVFTFSGGSSITAVVNPAGPFDTAPNEVGIVPANYGVTGSGPVFPVGNALVKGIYRNLVFDFSAGTAQNGSPMSGGSLRINTGELVWGAVTDSGPFDGISNLLNVVGPNNSTSNVTWDGTTLTIPVVAQTNGDNRVEVWTGTIVATLPSNPPTLVNARANHVGYSGAGTSVNESVALIQRGGSAQLVQLANLTNSNRGINGVVVDLTGLASLDDIALEYKMSPTGAFSEGSNPVSGWADAPAPSSVALQTGQGQGGSDRVSIAWADNAIANRYLSVRATFDGDPLFELYLGHLLGETTGATGGSFTCAFADITPIRSAVGGTVNASSPNDIDKNGTVSFADISVMRGNIGAQLTQITIPANP